MAEKRKDKKGRVLKTGESQRKDGTYQYRVKISDGSYRYIYAQTLKELREKEDSVQFEMLSGMNLSEDKITTYELCKRYVDIKQNIRYRTKVGYKTILNRLKKDPIGQIPVKSLKMTTVKRWFIQLKDEQGLSYSTVSTIKRLMKPAFKTAIDDDIIRKNPFDFRLCDVVTNDTKARKAIKESDLTPFFEFVQKDRYCKRYYDEFVIILGTGMRVSEICGLIVSDFDFEGNKVTVQRQLERREDGSLYVEFPKTDSGKREIPMTSDVSCSVKNVIKKRGSISVEPIVDGCTGFLFLDRKNEPYNARHVQNHLKTAISRYNKEHPGSEIPYFTPHNLRHTFCTDYANEGMMVQNLAYLMGHKNLKVTMGVYTHPDYENAREDMLKVISFKENAG